MSSSNQFASLNLFESSEALWKRESSTANLEAMPMGSMMGPGSGKAGCPVHASMPEPRTAQGRGTKAMNFYAYDLSGMSDRQDYILGEEYEVLLPALLY
jgi:hypothetical protein